MKRKNMFKTYFLSRKNKECLGKQQNTATGFMTNEIKWCNALNKVASYMSIAQ